MANPVYTYKCWGDARTGYHFHDRPGVVGEAPPERVTCPICGKTAGRYYGRPPQVIYRDTGYTGAQSKWSTRK